MRHNHLWSINIAFTRKKSLLKEHLLIKQRASHFISTERIKMTYIYVLFANIIQSIDYLDHIES